MLWIITINVPLILKMREIIFLRKNYFMDHFEGYFEGAKTFLTLCCARDNLGVKKVEALSKYPEKWPIK
jgi:hypothetical protein